MGAMERKALLTCLVILCAAFSGSLAGLIPSCVKKNILQNRMQCYNWQYNITTDICRFVPTVFLTLFPGMGFGVDFLYQPGRIQNPPMYANNYLCEWNIQPKDSCSRISLFIVDKDFHDPGTVSTNPSCDLSDHLELNYNSRQQNRYCGDAITNNCPFSNCILPQLSSDTEFNLTLRSDESDTAGGFFAVIINDDPVDKCSTKKVRSLSAFSNNTVNYNVVKKMAVPKTRTCDFLLSLNPATVRKLSGILGRGAIPCNCYGNCTVTRHYKIEWIISSIAKDTAGRVAYRYVNSLNPMLMKIARRALLNRKLFGTSVPTIQERVEYEQRKYATFCPTAISPFNGRFVYPQSYKAFWYS